MTEGVSSTKATEWKFSVLTNNTKLSNESVRLSSALLLLNCIYFLPLLTHLVPQVDVAVQ